MIGVKEAWEETPVFFPADDEHIFALLTSPSEPREKTAVVLMGGATTPSTTVGRNRMTVTLGRRLAQCGYHVLRFDYHGIGDSTGTVERFELNRPFIEDLAGALDWLRTRGMDSFILAGSCFGARTALSYAPKLAPLEAVVLLAPPLRDFGESERQTAGWSLWDYVKCAFRPQATLGGKKSRRGTGYLRFMKLAAQVMLRRLRTILRSSDKATAPWISRRNVLDPLSHLVKRRVPVLLMYGRDDDSYGDFQEAMRGRLGRIVRDGTGVIDVAVVAGKVHGFTTRESQNGVMNLVEDWLRRVRPMEEIKSA
jgi:pimeloyl-ACP methyl ester carboxylesterase